MNKLNATELHKNALVADLHCDTVMRMRSGLDIGLRTKEGHIDLSRLREGGVNLQVFACFVGEDGDESKCPAETDGLLDVLDREFARLSDQVEVCLTADMAQKIIDSGRIAAFLGIENGMAINNDLEKLQHYYNRGVRYMTLIHNISNGWCISANDKNPAFEGLTDFGCDVVRKMNDLRMIVDVSHVHPLGVTKALEVSIQPIIASHSCVFKICPHHRNLTDDQIKAIANSGGMIGMNYLGDFVSERRMLASLEFFKHTKVDRIALLSYGLGSFDKEKYGDIEDQLKTAAREWEAIVRPINPNVSDVVDHIDYIVNLVGDEFVGLGSDYDGIYLPPDGLEDTSCVPAITEELVKRDYSEDSIRRILGENFMRVFKDVCG